MYRNRVALIRIAPPSTTIWKLTGEIDMTEKGNLYWEALIDSQEVIETKEPLMSQWLRFKAWFMKIAPESQL